jgi:hypothetical protein
MKTYKVSVRIIQTNIGNVVFDVKANSEDEALELAEEQYGDYHPDCTEYDDSTEEVESVSIISKDSIITKEV